MTCDNPASRSAGASRDIQPLYNEQSPRDMPSARDLPPQGEQPSLQELPDGWREALRDEVSTAWFADLLQFVAGERAAHTVLPPLKNIYDALRLTPFEQVKVVLLGQDPYPTPGHAHGLCFSVPEGTRPPPSLANIFKELESDLGIAAPASGCLAHWARQGVLLLNTVLTLRAHEPNSHKGRGWERFTDAIIRTLNARPDPVIFVLWGAGAQKKRALIDSNRHGVIASAHPSPLSARMGFFGSKPFSRINKALCEMGKSPIDWSIRLDAYR